MELLTNLFLIGGAGVATFVAAPVVGGAALSVLGFKAGGIAAGSLAASMMSSSAIASGGGVAAGSLVATLQSVGAAGLGAGASAVAGTVASATTAAVQIMCDAAKDNC